MYQSSIFDYLKPTENTMLSHVNGNDLNEILFSLDNYYLSLRDSINLDDNITFGLEIEFEEAIFDRIKKNIAHTGLGKKWSIKKDYSLIRGEEVVSPVLRDNSKSWHDLKTICDNVEPYALIGDNSAGHIHIGAHVLGDKKEDYLNFLKLWSVYENIVFRFSYGDFITGRPSLFFYAEPMAQLFYSLYEDFSSSDFYLDELLDSLSENRDQAVNFDNVNRNKVNKYVLNNTIEFRCPNGTFDPVIWQNNVNLFARMILYSKSNKYDDYIISRRYRLKEGSYDELRFYNDVYFEQALEFCDLIFNNNLDKIYFLKQYLKYFDVLRNEEIFARSRKLTKQ